MKCKVSLAIMLISAWISLHAGEPPNWVLEGTAPWHARDSQAEFAFADKLWIMGGWFDSFEAPPRDVWASPDGKIWQGVTKQAPWVHSDLPMNLTFGDSMWIMGGWYNGRLPGHSASNQVWRSRDGQNWEQVTPAAGWSPRIAAAAVEFQGRMWILGGTENYYFGDEKSLKNDVWSSADGKTWRRETAAAPWQPRLWFSAAVYRGRIWVLGGWSKEKDNFGDVWHSADGQEWTRLKTAKTWKARHEHSALVHRDKLWILGGHARPLSSEVWSLHLPQDWKP